LIHAESAGSNLYHLQWQCRDRLKSRKKRWIFEILLQAVEMAFTAEELRLAEV
jgi:hypothetical protein